MASFSCPIIPTTSFAALMAVLPPVTVEERTNPASRKPEDVTSLKGTFSAERSEAIRRVTGNQTAGSGCFSRTDLSYEALPAILKGVEHRLLRGQVPIHVLQAWDLPTRIRAGTAFRVKATFVEGSKNSPDAWVVVNLMFYEEGDSKRNRVIATGKTILDFPKTTNLRPKDFSPATVGTPVGKPIVVTEELIDAFARASGYGIAQALGLGLLLGIASDDIALGLAGPCCGWQEGDGDVGKTKTSFKTPVRPGDTLTTYRNDLTVTVVNQWGEEVLRRFEEE